MEIIKFTEFIFHSGAPLDCVPSWALALALVVVVVMVRSQRAMFSEQQQKMPETDKRNRVRKTDSRLGGGVVKRLPLGH